MYPNSTIYIAIINCWPCSGSNYILDQTKFCFRFVPMFPLQNLPCSLVPQTGLKVVWNAIPKITFDSMIHMIVTYRWYITAWQTCSLPCGKGFQQRSVVCRQKIAENKWNTITNETLCVEPKPVVSPLERNCNEISCPPEYVAGQWSEVNKGIY